MPGAPSLGPKKGIKNLPPVKVRGLYLSYMNAYLSSKVTPLVIPKTALAIQA